MRVTVLVGALLLVGLVGARTFATDGHAVGPQRQWSIVNFPEPTQVGRAFLSGPYLIVHDEAKMARGEPCTTIYRWIPGKGPEEQVLSFMCIHSTQALAAQTTLTVGWSSSLGLATLERYQFAGDTDGHGVPRKAE